MRHQIFSAVSLATLLLACAHDQTKQHTHNEATAAERAEHRAERHERRAENEARREHGDDGVEVPRRRVDKDRLASANGTVPAHHDEKVSDESDDKDHLTALDQGNGEVDLDLTQRIRKAVMADDSLSFSAKNSKIITRDGHVTLRGKVTSAEKAAIYKSAVGAAGAGHVSNELEVDDD